MRVHDLQPSTHGPFAFEVSAAVGRRLATRIVEGVPGVRVLRRPGWLGRHGEEVFCEFVLKDQLFNIWEPLGKSSRYWIGPTSGRRTPALLPVRQAFIDYQFTGLRHFTHWLQRRKGLS